jgi:hypothetical protein
MIVVFGHSELRLVILLLIVGIESFEIVTLLSHLFDMGLDRVAIDPLLDILLDFDLGDPTLGHFLVFLISLSFTQLDFLLRLAF